MSKPDWSARSTPTPGERRLVPPPPPTDAKRPETDKEPKRNARSRGREQTGGAKPRKHFVEPYPYTADQRDAITRALADCGLGDATAREIFIGAIAYDLAVLAAALKASAEPAPPEATGPPESEALRESQASASLPVPSAADLAERARTLVRTLDALDESGRSALLTAVAEADPFRRDHGPAYLAALHAEIARLASAAATIADAGAGRTAPLAPPRGPNDRKPLSRKSAKIRGKPSAGDKDAQSALGFIRHAASVYEQCFDARPAPAADAPFARVLTALATATGIPIPTGADLLRRALTQR